MQKTIKVYNTHIDIENCVYGDCKQLDRFFSIYDKLYHTYVQKGILYRPKKKIVSVPRGISIPQLEIWFNTKADYIIDSDPYDSDVLIRLKYSPRDQVQYEAIQFITGMGKYTYTRNHSQLSVNLPTGAGKTYVTIVCGALYGVKSLMITSTIGWITQWREKIKEYTDTTDKEIYDITGVASIAKILRGVVDVSKIKYFLASHDTINSYGKKYGWSKVGELFKILRVGLKIYDEAHLDFDNICRIDFNSNTFKTLYLTATPARSDRDENKIYQAAFKSVPNINLFNEETDPRTSYLKLLYNSHPSPVDIEKCSTNYGFSMVKYCNYIGHRPNYYNLLRVIVDMVLRKNLKTLIYIGTNELISRTYEWLNSNYPELIGMIGIYTSMVPKDIKEDQLNRLIILSTTKSCGVAMDIPHLGMTVVLAEPFKSKVLAIQTLGRTRGRNTSYIEVVDVGFKPIRVQSNSKSDVFEKYAKEMYRVSLTDQNVLMQKVQQSIMNQTQRLIAINEQHKTVMMNPVEVKE